MDEMERSGFVMYSLGVVANNKPLDSDTIEVTPIEKMPMLDGEITDNAIEVSSKGATDGNGAYETKVLATTSIQAKWKPISGGNRISSPDVRRGDRVIIYRNHDVDDGFYWDVHGGGIGMRKLETIIWALSGSSEEIAKPSADNCYYLEASSHDKLITFSTSKKNGEIVAYKFQFNPGTGFLILQDDRDNSIVMNSEGKQIVIRNSDGSIFDMEGTNITATCDDTYTINCKDYVVNAENSITQKTQTYSLNAEATALIEAPNITLKGNTLLQGNFDLSGDMTTSAGEGGTTGKITLNKDIEILGNAIIHGTTTTTDLEVSNPPW